MIRTLIVDDEPLCLDDLSHMLDHYKDIKIRGKAKSMEEAKHYLENHDLDLVFLDIQMDQEKTGMEIANYISDQEKQPLIVFVTAYSQYAVESYDYESLSYLLKPVPKDKLDSVVQRVRRKLADNSKSLTSNVNKNIAIRYKYQDKYNDIIHATVYLAPTEILYIQTNVLTGNTEVHTTDGHVFKGVTKTLGEFKDRLVDSKFFPNHRSFLVNLHHVYTVRRRFAGEDNFILTFEGCSDVLPVSRLRVAELMAALESLNKPQI